MLLCTTCLNLKKKERSPFRQAGICTECGKEVSKGFFFAEKKPVESVGIKQTNSGYRCTECGEEIGHFQYSRSCTEFGNYYPENDNFEVDETDNSGGDVDDYICPECGVGVIPDDCFCDDLDERDEDENV